MRSLFSFPLGLPRSGVFPPPCLLFVCPRFTSWLGALSGPTPGHEWVAEVGRFSWGWGTEFAWEIWGIGVKVGEKVVSGCKGLKKTFSPLLSVSLSVSLSPPPLCLSLSPSLVKVGEVAGKGPGTLRLSAFGASQFLHNADSLSPGQWPGCLGVKGDPCFPPLAGSEGGGTPRTGALPVWGPHHLLSEH